LIGGPKKQCQRIITDKMTRTSHDLISGFLSRKITSFLSFLCDLQCGSEFEKLSFISQIDFWDWEVENIIYAVKTLDEVDQMEFPKFIRDIHIKPTDSKALLRKLMLTWDKLISDVELLLSDKDSEIFVKFNIPNSLDTGLYIKGSAKDIGKEYC